MNEILFQCITRARFGGGEYYDSCNRNGAINYSAQFPTLWGRYPSVCGIGTPFKFNIRLIDGSESGEYGASNEQEVIDILIARSSCANPYAAEQATQDQLAAEAAQLAVKTAMLQSKTAVFSSKDFYTAEVAETSAEIKAYNADVAAFLATAPSQKGVTEDIFLKKPAAQTTQGQASQGQDKKDNTDLYLIGTGIAVAGLAALYFAGRKK